MKLNKMETVALWLLGLSVPAFMFGALTFGGIHSAGVVVGFYVCTIFWIIAFPLGLLFLLVIQIVKWFSKRP